MYVRWWPSGPWGRQLATLAMISRLLQLTRLTYGRTDEAVLTATERLPDVDFVVDMNDLGHAVGAPIVGLDRRPEDVELFLQPDFGFSTWPEPGINSFIEVRDNIVRVEQGLAWAQKTPKLFFRGAAWVNGLRHELIEIVRASLTTTRLIAAQGEDHEEWSQVSNLDWEHGKDQMLAACRVLFLDSENDSVPMADHCKWRYLAHVEGVAYSGRLKSLRVISRMPLTSEQVLDSVPVYHCDASA